ncbi:MAG TPA: ABC transporter substrate-binding protein [Bacteroidales bacterium]|nr:ABC transporter substrate-binding protein [Bacteroidales bacterium]HQP05040.1 ABC transporter substrate-binding protein [Bacteroidales bacterium]
MKYLWCKPAVLLFWGTIVMLTSCTDSGENRKADDKPIKNKYARGFEIIQQSQGYTLRVFDPAQNSKNNSYSYRLTRNSAKKNEIHVPVKRIICCSTSHVAFLSALNEADKLTGISTGKLVFDTLVSGRFYRGEILDIGYETTFDMEVIVSLKPDVIFAYGVDYNSLGSFQKIEAMGIPVVWIGEYLEPDILGRTEWLLFFSCFFDKLNYAHVQFDSIADRYNKLVTTATQHKGGRPLVITGLPWRGTWFVPGGKSYFSSLIRDAGGEYIFSKDTHTESIPVPLEDVFYQAQNVSVWLNPNNCVNKKEILVTDSRFDNFAPLHQAIICNNNKRMNHNGGNDFWESGIIHPDIVLNDLIHIFHDTIINEDSLFYYRKL